MARITSTDAGSAVRCRWHRQPPISAAACMLSASMKCMPSSEIASKLAAIRDCCWKSALGAKLGIARAQRVGGAAGMARVLSNVFPRGRVLHGRGYQAVRAPSRLQRVPLARASTPEYQGKFGTWRVEEEDVREVFLYRLGLNVAAAGAVTGEQCRSMNAVASHRHPPSPPIAARSYARRVRGVAPPRQPRGLRPPHERGPGECCGAARRRRARPVPGAHPR